MNARKPVIRMLYFVRESFPSFRADVEVLFGQELLERRHEIDFVMQAEHADSPLGAQPWRGRTVFVGPTDQGDRAFHRARRLYLGLRHDIHHLVKLNIPRYDAIQVRDKFVFAAIAALFARRRGLRFFYWLSFPEPESQLARVREGVARFPVASWCRGKLFGWLLYRVILPRCDHAFVQSEQMQRDIVAHGISPEKLTPVPMGIAREAAEARCVQRTAEPHSPVVLVYLGTLSSQRRLEILVDTLALLRERDCNVRLLCIGGGDEPEDERRLLRRAEELQVEEYLELTGMLSRDEAMARLQSADIALSPFFPSSVLRSTSPTKLVEYLAMGLPVVANDHPEQRSVLKYSKGGLCVPWGARYFAKGVGWLVGQGGLRRQAIGRRGREWVLAHRSYDRIADQLEAQYLSLLSRATGNERA
jgi:glycosyltransferase involved in cell wall biosynthesis